jgi:hypothetical protein
MGIFEYILCIPMEGNFYVGNIGVPFKACINCVVFFLLNVYVRGVCWLISCVNNFDNSNARAFRQFIIRRMGWLCLWIFIRPFVVRAEGYILKYFHLESCGISVLLWFIVFRI